ncbi:MAG: tail fiber protein [Candidatus Electrothrix sp. AW2]|nr:tail fiber protein [Candidatus Electrothrix gigas]
MSTASRVKMDQIKIFILSVLLFAALSASAQEVEDPCYNGIDGPKEVADCLEKKQTALLDLLKAQQEVIENLKKTLLPNIQPVGSLVFLASEKAPAGYLYCDGSVRSRTEYNELFAAIGTTWGAGDGSSTFNLPDLRGEFIRVWSKNGAVDAGRKVGQAQGQSTSMPNAQFETVAEGGHTHGITASGNQTTSRFANHNHAVRTAGNHRHQITTVTKGSCQDRITLPFGATIPAFAIIRCNQQYGKKGITGYSFVSGSQSKPATAVNKNGSIVTAGNHTHMTKGNGAHTHTVSSHTHPLAEAMPHTHNITGGDQETRPRNQALACYIKAFSHSAF